LNQKCCDDTYSIKQNNVISLDTMSEYSKDDSKTTNDGASEVDRIVNTLKGGSGESPEKKAYFHQKTKLLQVEDHDKKRRSDMALARDLRHECTACDSDDEDDRLLKKRMKSASRRIIAHIMDDVDGAENNPRTVAETATAAAEAVE
jgi:hypothetical protein